MNKWQPKDWEHKEIDIEFLGKDTRSVQFTVHHFKDKGKNHVYKKYTYNLGFDSSEGFHDYMICWSKDSISWFVDDKWVHSEKDILIDEKMYVRMNHWAADPSDKTGIKEWLGPVDLSCLPSKVYYDYFSYKPIR